MKASHIVFELQPFHRNLGKRLTKSTKLYFWRDQSGHEVDLLLGSEYGFTAIEIKSAQTIHSSMYANLGYVAELYGDSVKKRVVVYGGTQSQNRANGMIVPWNQLDLDSLL